MTNISDQDELRHKTVQRMVDQPPGGLMDPKANIRQQIQIAREIQAIYDKATPEPEDTPGWREYDEAKADRNELLADLSAQLAELVLVLQEG
jgi:hypothetical protein